MKTLAVYLDWKEKGLAGWLHPNGEMHLVKSDENHWDYLKPFVKKTREQSEYDRYETAKKTGWVDYLIEYTSNGPVIWLRMNNYDDLNREQKKAIEKETRNRKAEIKIDKNE